MERVVVVSSPGSRIYVRRGVVYVENKEGERLALTADVGLVILTAGASSISGRALRRLSELGIRLIVLGHHGRVVGELRPVDRVNKTIEARLAQYRVRVEGRGLLYAKAMVRAKMENQARVLAYIARARRLPSLLETASRITMLADRLNTVNTAREVMGVEAEAARLYWQAIAGLLPPEYGFRGREPRAGDPVNMALSYGYAIIYSIVGDALTVAGLDPYAGFLHADRSGRPSLVYDYADMFKPVAVDKPLLASPDPQCFDTFKGTLSYQARRAIAKRILENLYRMYSDRQGARKTLRDHIYRYAWLLAASLRSNTPYKGFVVRT
ncbi:MAG: CRISPR-associated endonuclease Cas1 [Crenarchaeota archaeon]|nr:CRISPR-associated endonuclease Cas1 [Thermoproteota archaeon]